MLPHSPFLRSLAENYRVQPGLKTSWLYLVLFVEAMYKDHIGRFEMDGSACLAKEAELEDAIRLFIAQMTER
jgi:hypothetical protein